MDSQAINSNELQCEELINTGVVEKYSIYFIILGLILLPISNLSYWIIFTGSVIGCCFTKNRPPLFSLLKNYRLLSPVYLLTILVFIGCFYSTEPFFVGIKTWFYYAHHLICFSACIFLFRHKPYQQLALHAFFFSIIIASFIQASPYAQIIHVELIPFSIMLAFTAYWSLSCISTCKTPTQACAFLLISAWLIYFIFFINYERSGMLLMLINAILLLIQTKKKTRFLLFIILMTGISCIYLSSHNVQYKTNQLISEIKTLQTEAHKTSIGIRITYIYYSWKIIQNNLWLGVGTSGFTRAYQKTLGPRITDSDYNKSIQYTGRIYPENQYLLTWVECGVFSVLCYCWWLFNMAFIYNRCLPTLSRLLLRCLTLNFIISSGLIIAFINYRMGTGFVTIAGILLAETLDKQKTGVLQTKFIRD